MIEKVLVIPKTVYKSNLLLGDLKDLVAKHGTFMDRPEAEKDTNFLQLIPYIVVKKGQNIFCYERLKKGTETRLHSKCSLGIGGHINSEDAITPDGVEVTKWVTLETGAYRELHDELTITNPSTGQLGDVVIDFTPLIIYDDSNDVGKVHLGLVGICDVSHCDVMVGEPDKIAGSFIDIYKLKGKMGNMETWSQIVMDNQHLWMT